MWGMRCGRAQSQDLPWGLWGKGGLVGRQGRWVQTGRASRFLRLIHVVLEAVDRTAAEGAFHQGGCELSAGSTPKGPLSAQPTCPFVPSRIQALPSVATQSISASSSLGQPIRSEFSDPSTYLSGPSCISDPSLPCPPVPLKEQSLEYVFTRDSWGSPLNPHTPSDEPHKGLFPTEPSAP